jgi:hypothetical protein
LAIIRGGGPIHAAGHVQGDFRDFLPLSLRDLLQDSNHRFSLCPGNDGHDTPFSTLGGLVGQNLVQLTAREAGLIKRQLSPQVFGEKQPLPGVPPLIPLLEPILKITVVAQQSPPLHTVETRDGLDVIGVRID